MQKITGSLWQISMYLIGYLLVLSNPVYASSYEEKRIENSRNNQENLESRRDALASNEFILLSLNPGATISQISVAARESSAVVTAIHLCAISGRVIAFLVDPKLPLMPQLKTIVNDTMPEMLEQNQRLIDAPEAVGPETAKILSLKEKNPTELVKTEFCGVEAKLTFDKFSKFKSFFGETLLAAEVTNSKRRMYALNMLRVLIND